MKKELYHLIFIGFGMIIFILLFTKIFYQWTEGIQPNNFEVMIVLLMAISFQSKFTSNNKS